MVWNLVSWVSSGLFDHFNVSIVSVYLYIYTHWRRLCCPAAAAQGRASAVVTMQHCAAPHLPGHCELHRYKEAAVTILIISTCGVLTEQ